MTTFVPIGPDEKRAQTIAVIAAILMIGRDGMYDADEIVEEAADLLGAAIVFIDKRMNQREKNENNS